MWSGRSGRAAPAPPVSRDDIQHAAAVVGVHLGLAGVVVLDPAHELGQGAQRVHGVKLQLRRHRLALGLLRRLQFPHLR